MRPGRRRRVDDIPEGQPAVAGVNIRTLRQRRGWSQAKLGELMGWPSASTVCAAEGHRGQPAAWFHCQGNRAASRHLRYLARAAHGAVRELRRPPAVRVRLPGLRSRARPRERPLMTVMRASGR